MSHVARGSGEREDGVFIDMKSGFVLPLDHRSNDSKRMKRMETLCSWEMRKTSTNDEVLVHLLIQKNGSLTKAR